jgi:hypothetical protein
MGNQESAAMKKFSTATEATQRLDGTDTTARRWSYEQAFGIPQAKIAEHAHTLRAGSDEDEVPRLSELTLRIADRIDEQRGAGR